MGVMLKLLLGAMGGVFVGALMMEILRRKRASTAEKIEEKARHVVRRIGLGAECQPEE